MVTKTSKVRNILLLPLLLCYASTSRTFFTQNKSIKKIDIAILSVHEGFYDAYLELSGGVHQGLMDVMALKPDYQLVVTGHSLGGAMATLCALNLTVNYGLDPIVYTFGSPRVGFQNFADFYYKEGKSSPTLLLLVSRVHSCFFLTFSFFFRLFPSLIFVPSASPSSCQLSFHQSR
jgi:predicted lipase